MTFEIVHADNTVTKGVENGKVTLQPQEKLVMKSLYKVTEKDMEALEVNNTASAKGYEPDPFDPETPRDPDKPITPDKPATAKVFGEKPKPELPKTGETRINPLFSFLFVSAGVYLILKKKEEEFE